MWTDNSRQRGDQDGARNPAVIANTMAGNAGDRGVPARGRGAGVGAARGAGRRRGDEGERSDRVERALRFESQYRPGTNLKAWVHQILFSVFITKCRRNRRERKALDILCSDPNAWTAAPAVSEVTGLSPSTRKALDAIPSVYRDVVVMVDVEEISYKDAADKLEVPVGTVMSRLHRGRRMLAEALKDSQDKAA